MEIKKQIWKAEPIIHKGSKRIAVYFEKNAEWASRIAKIRGARWSYTLHAWHIPDTLALRIRFKIENESDLIADKKEDIDAFIRWLRSKRYSESTIKTYVNAIRSFLVFYNHKPISEINNKDVIIYNNEFILKNGLSSSYQNQIVNAIKLFFTIQTGLRLQPELVHRPKNEKKLPNVLSKEEIKLILSAPKNIKHRAMLCLLYSCGL